MKQYVIDLATAVTTIRSAIRVHARDEKHPNQDVLLGCKTCSLLLATYRSLQSDSILVEV